MCRPCCTGKAHHLLLHSSIQYTAVLKGYGAPCQFAGSLPVSITCEWLPCAGLVTPGVTGYRYTGVVLIFPLLTCRRNEGDEGDAEGREGRARGSPGQHGPRADGASRHFLLEYRGFVRPLVVASPNREPRRLLLSLRHPLLAACLPSGRSAEGNYHNGRGWLCAGQDAAAPHATAGTFLSMCTRASQEQSSAGKR